MDENAARLVKCFQVVFPNLSVLAIPTATQDSVEIWDSVAMIALINVVEEEFGIQLDLEHTEEFNSFQGLHQRISAGPGA